MGEEEEEGEGSSGREKDSSSSQHPTGMHSSTAVSIPSTTLPQGAKRTGQG